MMGGTTEDEEGGIGLGHQLEYVEPTKTYSKRWCPSQGEEFYRYYATVTKISPLCMEDYAAPPPAPTNHNHNYQSFGTTMEAANNTNFESSSSGSRASSSYYYVVQKWGWICFCTTLQRLGLFRPDCFFSESYRKENRGRLYLYFIVWLMELGFVSAIATQNSIPTLQQATQYGLDCLHSLYFGSTSTEVPSNPSKTEEVSVPVTLLLNLIFGYFFPY